MSDWLVVSWATWTRQNHVYLYIRAALLFAPLFFFAVTLFVVLRRWRGGVATATATALRRYSIVSLTPGRSRILTHLTYRMSSFPCPVLPPPPLSSNVVVLNKCFVGGNCCRCFFLSPSVRPSVAWRTQSCGVCGGPGCGTIPGTGGSAFCCPSTIRDAGQVTKTTNTNPRKKQIATASSMQLYLVLVQYGFCTVVARGTGIGASPAVSRRGRS